MPRENDSQRFKSLDFFPEQPVLTLVKIFEGCHRKRDRNLCTIFFNCSTSETSTPNTDLYNLQNLWFNGAGDFLSARRDAVRKVSARVSREGGQSHQQMISGCGTSSCIISTCRNHETSHKADVMPHWHFVSEVDHPRLSYVTMPSAKSSCLLYSNFR